MSSPLPPPYPLLPQPYPLPQPHPVPPPAQVLAQRNANDTFSGIDPVLMDQVESQMAKAEEVLGRSESLIRNVLQRLDLDTSGLAVMREVRGWIGTTRPDLRRRSEAIRAEVAEWGPTPGEPSGMQEFDEARYGKARDPHVYAAAGKLAEATRDGKLDDKALAELEKRAGDPEFTTALANALGATAFRGLLTKAAARGNDKAAARLQAALGRTLGTASAHLGRGWREEFTSRLGRSWEEAHGIAKALNHGRFDGVFLTQIARKIDAWDRQIRAAPTLGDPGVIVALMSALSRNPAAAQDFFTEDPTTLKRYLMERPTKDGGEALGKALEAATLSFRDHDGTPSDPSRGYLSAKLASELVHLSAQGILEDDFSGYAAPASIGRILGGYVSDISRVARGRDDRGVPGVIDIDNPSMQGKESWGAKFAKEDLRLVMKEAFKDSDAFLALTADQTVFSGKLLDHGAAEIAAGRGSQIFKDSAELIGAGFALITDSAGLAKIDNAKELDETQKRNMQIFTAVLNTTLAIPQRGAFPIASGVVSSWTGLLEDSVKNKAEIKAIGEANTAVDQAKSFVRDITAQAMLKHGLFGSADPPAETHPWGSLQDLREGDDPRNSPYNFLKDDGRTLMTREEMIDETATNSTDMSRRFDAYRRWLEGGLAGERWRDVEGELTKGFSRGFAEYRR